MQVPEVNTFWQIKSGMLAKRRFMMREKQVWGVLSIIAGIAMLIWWVSFWAPGFMDCWIGGYCNLIFIPAGVGIILIAAGLILLLKKGKDDESC
jgi:hypothetical protein